MTSLLMQPQSVILESILHQEMSVGEHMLWYAMPDPKRMKVVFWIWAFAIPWTAFALFWEGTSLSMMVASASAAKNNLNFSWFMAVFPIFGLPFVGVGFWMMYKPFAALAEARNQIHALTNTRLITLTMRKAKELKSIEINKIGPVTSKECADGWGNLSVATGIHTNRGGDSVTVKFEMYGIPDVAKLERLLREAKAGLA